MRHFPRAEGAENIKSDGCPFGGRARSPNAPQGWASACLWSCPEGDFFHLALRRARRARPTIVLPQTRPTAFRAIRGRKVPVHRADFLHRTHAVSHSIIRPFHHSIIHPFGHSCIHPYLFCFDGTRFCSMKFPLYSRAIVVVQSSHANDRVHIEDFRTGNV